MQYKKNVLLLSIAAVALAVTFVVGVIVRNVQTGPGPSYDFVSGLTKDNIASITISHGTDMVDLSKQDSGWSLAFAGSRVSAKTSRVETLVTAILGLKSLRAVSNSPATHEQLKITDALAYKVEIADKTGAIKRSVLLGDSTGQGVEQFVRETGNDTVYTTNAGLSFDLQQKASYWADMQAWPASIAGTKAIEIGYDSREVGAFSLVKTTKDGVDTWLDAARPTLDQTAIASWVRGITNLEGEDLVVLDQGRIPEDYGSEVIRINAKGSNASAALEAHRPKTEGAPWLLISKDHAFKTENGREYGLLVADWKIKADVFKK